MIRTVLLFVLLWISRTSSGDRSATKLQYGRAFQESIPREAQRQQQVIVPGGFQQLLLQSNLPALRTTDTRNTHSRVIPTLHNGHFQLRNPSLVTNPSRELRQRYSSPLTTAGNPVQTRTGINSGNPSGSAQDFRESQYEYYDDGDSDIVYHYSNEDPEEVVAGGSSVLPPVGSKSSTTVIGRGQKQEIRNIRPISQTSSFIPLVEEDEPLAENLAFKGRSVHPQPSFKNLGFNSSPNPTPLPGLLRNTSVITKNRNAPSIPPQQPIISKRPGVFRGPVNRFSVTTRPQSSFPPHASASPGSGKIFQLASKNLSVPVDSDDKTVPLEEEYVEEYHEEDGDAYYEGEGDGRLRGNDKSETKAKVTVSVSTKGGSTTPSSVLLSKSRTTATPGIVISVATTKSISDNGKEIPTPTTPKVTFSRATGSSIVVASVQTSRSVSSNSGSPLKPNELKNSGSTDSLKLEPEYYEEEYAYPDNYPILNTTSVETKSSVSNLLSPSPTESIMDKLDRVQSDLVNGVLSGLHSPSSTVTPVTATSRENVEIEIPHPAYEKQKTNGIISTEKDQSNVKSFEGILKSIKFKDASGLLPTDYNSPVASVVPNITTAAPVTTTSSTPASLLPSITFEEALSDLLPKGYRPSIVSTSTSTPTTSSTATTKIIPISTSTQSTTTKPKTSSLESLLSKVKFSDVSALLPPGYDESRFAASSSTTTTSKPTGIELEALNINFDDISKFLPPGYKPPEESTSSVTPQPSELTSTSTVPTPTTSKLPPKGVVFPTRPGGIKFIRPGSTEAPKADTPPPPKVTIQAGWPQRKTTAFTGWPTSSTTPTSSSSTTTEMATTTTVGTTTTTTRPTTTTLPPKRSAPTTCVEAFCKMEAIVKIVGFRWKPEYGDINTEEFKHLERTVKRELDAAYRSSGLAQYYRSIEIEGFTKGSIIVDYFVIVENVANLTSANVRALFHASLPPSDQHDFSGDNYEGDVGLAPDERLRLGRYVIDPKYTDFKVRNASNEIQGASASEGLIPQWGIAVIVIGLASLMFVIIFGVTVLVNRHKNSKKKNAVSLTQEMLSEFNKTHSYGVDNYGADDLYNMNAVWDDKPPPNMDRTFDRKPGKRSYSSGKDSTNYNIYDSWKTEWNGYYYNGNYYGDSGYAASRRRSDYDTNF